MVQKLKLNNYNEFIYNGNFSLKFCLGGGNYLEPLGEFSSFPLPCSTIMVSVCCLLLLLMSSFLHHFFRYFTEQTSQLLRVMLDADDSEDHIMTVEMVEGLQLDPDRDRLFLTALAQVWGLNVTVQHLSDVLTCCL